MRYEGMVYRPPSEAYSLIIQITIGCTHNKCTFCNMFKAKKFRVRDVNEVMEDLQMARNYYKHVRKIFLADGDALALRNDKLIVILDRIAQLFPECERVAIYGSPKDVLRKTPEELEELRDKGIGIIYIGAESGNEQVLVDVKKNATRDEVIKAVRMIEDAGIKSSVTFINGLGGKEMWREHAVDTGSMITEMQPSYVGLLTLVNEPGTEMYDNIKSGKMTLLSAEEVLAETKLMLENINLTKPCVFRSNHASNYVALKGDLPVDKEKMIRQLEHAMEHKDGLRDERFRMV